MSSAMKETLRKNLLDRLLWSDTENEAFVNALDDYLDARARDQILRERVEELSQAELKRGT